MLSGVPRKYNILSSSSEFWARLVSIFIVGFGLVGNHETRRNPPASQKKAFFPNATMCWALWSWIQSAFFKYVVYLLGGNRRPCLLAGRACLQPSRGAERYGKPWPWPLARRRYNLYKLYSARCHTRWSFRPAIRSESGKGIFPAKLLQPELLSASGMLSRIILLGEEWF